MIGPSILTNMNNFNLFEAADATNMKKNQLNNWQSTIE